MKLVIQRVSSAQVSVGNKVVGEIDKGLLVLLGVKQDDTLEETKLLAEKLIKLRIMADENGKMNLSVADAKAKVLVVSQFTLYADTSKGNRPSFIKAADPAKAEEIYKHFIEYLKHKGIHVETGSFGDYMEINTILDGPVTIIL
jgi:D-aminoacyl-tRNA deacylase